MEWRRRRVYIVLFSRLEIYAVSKTVGHRRRTVSYIFAFCKDINASSLLFFHTYFSITTRSHRIVSRTLLVVKTPSSTRAHKKAEVVKTHYICIYITGLVKQKKNPPTIRCALIVLQKTSIRWNRCIYIWFINIVCTYIYNLIHT